MYNAQFHGFDNDYPNVQLVSTPFGDISATVYKPLKEMAALGVPEFVAVLENDRTIMLLRADNGAEFAIHEYDWPVTMEGTSEYLSMFTRLANRGR